MAKAKSKKKIIKRPEKRGNVFYIMSPQCGWCKKADPVVKELLEQDYKLTTLDVTTDEGAKQAQEIKQKHGLQCGTPLFVEEKTGENVCGFREKDVMLKWLDGEPLPAPPRPKSPMPRPPFMNAKDEEVNKWKEDYTKWAEENKHLPGIKTADEMLAMPRPKSDPPQPPNASMTDQELEMWSLEWDEWAMNNGHLPGLQTSEQLIARFKPQWENQFNQLSNQVKSKNINLPDSGFYYFFSPQCAFCTEASKQVNDLNKKGYKITKKDISITEDRDFQQAILFKYKIQCGTPMMVDISNGNYLCGQQPDEKVNALFDGKLESDVSSVYPPIPPNPGSSEKQISDWVLSYDEYLSINSNKELPSAEEYMEDFFRRKQLVVDHKKLLNANIGKPDGIDDNPNLKSRYIGGQDAVGMVTHASTPKFNTRWYYHVMGPGQKTMVHADNKHLQEMKYQYLHREADGTYTKVIGDQWLQNDLLNKHKEFMTQFLSIDKEQ